MSTEDYTVSKTKTKRYLEELVGRVEADKGRKQFHVGEMGDGFYIQIHYIDDDIITGLPEQQKGRKWYVSGWATDSEVFQTMLKAALASAEHEVREGFTVDGLAIYGPHIDANVLMGVMQSMQNDGEDHTDARQHLTN